MLCGRDFSDVYVEISTLLCFGEHNKRIFFFNNGKIIITFHYIIGIKRNFDADESNFATDFHIADQHFHLLLWVCPIKAELPD